MLLDLTLSLSRDNPIFRQVLPANLSNLLVTGHIGTHLDTSRSRNTDGGEAACASNFHRGCRFQPGKE